MSTLFDRYDRHLVGHDLDVTAYGLHMLGAQDDEPYRSLARSLLAALNRVVKAEDVLREQGDRLHDTINRVEHYLDSGDVSSVNSSGELHSTALRYDTACAELGVARELLASLTTAWNNIAVGQHDPATILS